MDTILLTGKTSLFSSEALQMAGESCRVLVTGRKFPIAAKDLPENILRLPVRYKDSDFQKAFELGQVRAVWHVSINADGGRTVNELKQLETILQLCALHGIPRLIVLTESTDPTDYQKLIDDGAMPEEGMSRVDVMVLHLPLLTGTGTARGRLRRMFGAMEERRTIRLQGYADTGFSVLSMRDLMTLLLRMTAETWCRPGVFAADTNQAHLAQLRETLLSIRPDGLIEYSESAGASAKERRMALSQKVLRVRLPESDTDYCDGQICELYRLKASSDWSREIAAQYAALQEGGMQQSSGIAGMLAFLRQFGKLAGVVLDVAVMFFLAEYLSRITSESVYFKIVDVRLLFVILMGMMHGLATGIVAAALECVMLVIRYQEVGISGLLLFYNVENWIPFVYYLTAGAICGYSHRKKAQEMRSVNAENDLIRNKYLFLNEAYRASVSDRRELRAQILCEEESYARLYGAIRRMSQRTPEAVCVEAVRVMRDLLENPTVSIYQFDASGSQAQILSCCLENAVRHSILPEKCPQMMEVTGRGETWKNGSLYEDVPMYAAQVRYRRSMQQGYGSPREITLLVTVEQAGQDQMNLWYMNHFSILCGLFQDALEHASLRERSMD